MLKIQYLPHSGMTLLQTELSKARKRRADHILPPAFRISTPQTYIPEANISTIQLHYNSAYKLAICLSIYAELWLKACKVSKNKYRLFRTFALTTTPTTTIDCVSECKIPKVKIADVKITREHQNNKTTATTTTTTTTANGAMLNGVMTSVSWWPHKSESVHATKCCQA